MAIKDGNKIVPVTLTPFQIKKLEIMCQRSGLSKTGVIQRLIEGTNVFELSRDTEKKSSS